VKMSDNSPPLGNFSNLVKGAGSLPLSAVVGASSAFLGNSVLNPHQGVEAFIAGALDGDMAIWAPNGAFLEGRALVDDIFMRKRVRREDCEALASNAVCALVDGAFTDNTGIAHAVATGATEVVALIDLTPSDDPTDLLKLFSPSVHDVLPIFGDLASDVRAEYNNPEIFPRLSIPADSKYLVRITAGALKAQTIDNKFFGVTGGRVITIHVVAVTSSLNIGELVDFHNYSVLAQEIIATLTSEANMPLVQDRLLAAFLG